MIIAQNEIPVEVLDEIKKYYPTIKFNNYGNMYANGNQFNPNVSTKKINFVFPLGEVVDTEMIWDLDTSAPMLVKDSPDKFERVRGYYVRAVYTDDVADIYEVSAVDAIRKKQ